jgi:hypothetical protein
MDRPRAHGERGFAMVTVIGVLCLGLLLGAVAVSGAESGVASTVHDQHSRRAIQAAISGVEIARRRLNAFELDLSNLLGGTVNVCLGQVSVSGQSTTDQLAKVTATAGSWCPLVTIDLGTGTTATYQISPLTITLQSNTLFQTNELFKRRIVATGTADGVTRRVYLEVTAGAIVKKLGTVLTGGSLDIYDVVPGSFRECRSVAVSSSAPDADC